MTEETNAVMLAAIKKIDELREEKASAIAERDTLLSANRELVEALEEMSALIGTIKNAAGINDEYGRVVIGQADAARKLFSLHQAAISRARGEG